MGQIKAKVEQMIQAVSIGTPIFVTTARAPALRVCNVIDDTWRSQDWLPRSLTW